MTRASDPLSRAQRSELMSSVRSTGNRSTESRVQAALVRRGLRGWVKHASGVPGRPDFYFPRFRLVLFVDGCFWHACPHCARRVPASRSAFWRRKIHENHVRDRRVRDRLRRNGFHVLRVWEHEVRSGLWLDRLLRKLDSIHT